MLQEVLTAWGLWPGSSRVFYKEIGSSEKGIASLRRADVARGVLGISDRLKSITCHIIFNIFREVLFFKDQNNMKLASVLALTSLRFSKKNPDVSQDLKNQAWHKESEIQVDRHGLPENKNEEYFSILRQHILCQP